jgi:hypothetical protein
VRVFGDGRRAFAHALQDALRRTLGLDASAPLPLDLQDDGLPQDTQADELCWLLAWEADEQVSGTEDLAALQVHQTLRQTLNRHGLSYQVLRGTPEERLAHALQSLASRLPALAPLLPRTGVSSRRPGTLRCDRCGDPDCEQQSLSRLLDLRQAQDSACARY